MPSNIGGVTVHKFGHNTDSDTGDDVWDGSNAYPFPSAAAETTVASSSVNDTVAGTGARTIRVYGLDANFYAIDEVVTLNGTSNVTLTNEYLRVFRAKVLTAGSNETNAGNIQVKHGATVLTQITANFGQTLMAIYTIPASYHGWLDSWRAAADGSGDATIAFQARENGGAWQTKDILILDINGSSAQQVHYKHNEYFPPKTDLRVRMINGTSGRDVVAQFDLRLEVD